MNLIILGPPGAGKGTQSNNIAKDFNLKQVSTGDLLRDEIKLQTILGKKIELIIANGEFVPDEIVNTLIEKINKQHSVLVDVIQYLDSTKQSNTLIRSQVDTILNFEKKLKEDSEMELTKISYVG